MAVYTLKGEELVALYDVTGMEIDTAYDLQGTEIFTSIEPVDLAQVSEMFRQSCVDAAAYLNGLGDGYYNYIARADTHYPMNFCHSAMVCNYLYSHARVNQFMILGDFVNDINIGGSGWETVVNDGTLLYPHRTLFAQGNHDTHLVPLSAAEELLLPLTAHHAVSATYNPPYYWDDKAAKIRFLVIHHGSGFTTSEAVNWIHYRPEGYKWALLNHYPWNNGTWGADMCRTDGDWLHDLMDAESGFIGNFCGHLHLDSMDNLQTPKGTGYWQMTFDTDGSGGRADNLDGQSVTIVSINPKTENVKFYRIGRSTAYGKQWEYTGFTK